MLHKYFYYFPESPATFAGICTENGYVIPCLCEEVGDYRRSRKVLNLPQTNRGT